MLAKITVLFGLGMMAITAVACGGPSKADRGYQKPKLQELLTALAERGDKAQSFLAESRMEYWVNDERIKPTVYVMGERGAKIRFNALNPTGGDVAADLACNGENFQFVDYNKNCQLTGPCTKESIGKLLRINLVPDDFLLLAIGSTPVIADPTGTVKWDAKNRRERIMLTSGDGQWRQEISLSGKGQNWDVVSSTVWNSEDKIEWKLTNKEFSAKKAEDGQVFRLPAKTRFEQPQVKAEVSIRWIERDINVELSSEKFEIDMNNPPLPQC